jgi:FeS assembly SUF system protein
MKQVANSDMVKQAVGEDQYDELQEPPRLEASKDHKFWPLCRKALMDIYDPEIPTNIYELGLILKVILTDDTDAGVTDCHVEMTLTSPGCPVAQEMPGWVNNALMPIEGIGEVTVDIVWDPVWDPTFMSETAKMELNMF